jgi:hypothetical protein
MNNLIGTVQQGRAMRVLFERPSMPKPQRMPMSEQDEAEYISQNFGVSLSAALKIVQKKRKKRVDRR